MSLLEVQSLSIGYGRVNAVRDIDLSVGEGSLVALLGPNGAGKTSLISGISGVVRPASGTVHFAGRDITRRSAHRLARQGLRLVPESRALFPGMTVGENLKMGLDRADRRMFESRTEKITATFPVLGQRLKQPAGTLSGGEQQMLSIARALIGEPRLLILDEPSMGLAPQIIAEIIRVLGRLRDDGLTVLVAEQNARAVLPVADRAAILVRGRIRFFGDPGEVGERLEEGYLGRTDGPSREPT